MTLKSDSEDAAAIEMLLDKIRTGRVRTLQQEMKDRTGPLVVPKIHELPGKRPESTIKDGEAEMVLAVARDQKA